MSKVSSYQKIKNENLKLKQDIYTILREKDPIKKFSVTTRWNIIFQTEEIVWYGSPTKLKT
jgi:hypothetical protein